MIIENGLCRPRHPAPPFRVGEQAVQPGQALLGSLSFMGLRDIHKMNALKTVLGTLINVIAFIIFAFGGLVVWPIAIVMAAGTIVGGFGGARLARRVDQRLLRAFIIAVGLIVLAWFFPK